MDHRDFLVGCICSIRQLFTASTIYKSASAATDFVNNCHARVSIILRPNCDRAEYIEKLGVYGLSAVQCRTSVASLFFRHCRLFARSEVSAEFGSRRKRPTASRNDIGSLFLERSSL